MRKILNLILIGLIATVVICGSVFAFLHREELISPCLPPLRYSIGTVDPQFELSREKFTSTVFQAEKIWENALKKDVFQYDPNATFTVNLLYDERQSKTNKSLQLEKEIDSGKETYDQMKSKLETDTKTYESLISQYNILLKQYEADVAEYNATVASWNKKGGAPKKEYEQLQEDLESIEAEQSKLNTLISQINALAKSSEQLVTTLNSTADNINSTVDAHNTLFDNGEEFNKGIFNKDQIDIYQFVNQEDLLLTLVHEMGHSLHITEHTQDSKSIMYYLMQEQPTDSIALTQQDIDAAIYACRFDVRTTKDYLDALYNYLAHLNIQSLYWNK